MSPISTTSPRLAPVPLALAQLGGDPPSLPSPAVAVGPEGGWDASERPPGCPSWVWAPTSCGPRRRPWPLACSFVPFATAWWGPARGPGGSSGRAGTNTEPVLAITTLSERDWQGLSAHVPDGGIRHGCHALAGFRTGAVSRHGDERSEDLDCHGEHGVARRGRAGRVRTGGIRPSGGLPPARSAQADAPLASGRRGHVGPGVQGVGARRLRAGRARHLGAEAAAPGQALRRPRRPAAARRTTTPRVGVPTARATATARARAVPDASCGRGTATTRSRSTSPSSTR